MTPPEYQRVIPTEVIHSMLPERIPAVDPKPLSKVSTPLEESLVYGPPFTSDMDPENNHAIGPSFITEDTCNIIRRQLNIDMDTKSFAISPVDQNLSNPLQFGLALAQSYYECLQNQESSPTNKHGIHYQIGQWLNKYNDNELSRREQRQIAMAKNAAYIGIAIVITAFQEEWGYDFIDRLKEIDSSKIFKAFERYPVGLNKNLTITERGENIKPIPKHQAFLRELVEHVSDTSGVLGTYVEDGAAAAYGVIEEIWPSLINPPAIAQDA